MIEPFHPDRMASRILGMGDVLTLIEKAEQSFDEKKALEAAERLRANRFTLTDYLDQMGQLKNMGDLESIASMIPGMNASALKGAKVDDKLMARQEAIILSMTPAERENPSVLNSSRKKRIAAGSGTQVVDVNRLLKQFEAMQQMMKQFSGKKAPYYRVVVADSRSPRDGRFIEELGVYDPMAEGNKLNLDVERVKYWISQGAQPTDTVRGLLKKIEA